MKNHLVESDSDVYYSYNYYDGSRPGGRQQEHGGWWDGGFGGGGQAAAPGPAGHHSPVPAASCGDSGSGSGLKLIFISTPKFTVANLRVDPITVVGSDGLRLCGEGFSSLFEAS